MKRQKIITAYSYPDLSKIVAGTNLLNGGNEQVYDSEYSVIHENHTVGFNDVGLIRVAGAIEFNEKVQPIKLPTEDFAKIGYPAVLTGWGQVSLDFCLNEFELLENYNTVY